MPNWCENDLYIEADKQTIDSIQDGFLAGKLLHTIRPEPQHENEGDWYEWRWKHWGTKWEIDTQQADFERVSDTEIRFWFNSAWSPPTFALDASGLVFTLEYQESGEGFIGRASRLVVGENSTDETYDVREAPQYLLDAFGIDLTELEI